MEWTERQKEIGVILNKYTVDDHQKSKKKHLIADSFQS